MQRRELHRPSLQAGFVGILLFALAVGSQFVWATYGAGSRKPAPTQATEVPQAERTRLRTIEGIPLVRLSGSPFEMGRQHGAVLREQIRFLIEEYFEGFAVKFVTREAFLDWARQVEPFIPEEYREELRGLAEGAGIPYEQALLVNTMVDRIQALMCSTVVASGEATVDGEVYFGRNLDFPGKDVLNRATVVLVYEPEGGTPLVSVTWPGVIGVLSGMNIHGVAGATMLIHKGADTVPGMPYMMMYRRALSRARKMSDVYDVVAATKRTCANNFMVVDGTGAAEVLEFDPARVARRGAVDGSLCSTNYFVSKELRGEGWRLGVGRFRRLSRFLEEERGKIDLAAVKGALLEVAPWPFNVQAMVFLPRRRALHLSVGGDLPAAKRPYVYLDREVLFGK